MDERIYATGADGLVGSRFVELNQEKYDFLTPSIDILNILDPVKLDEFFEKYKPDFVVHFAAFTNVGAAENQRGDEEGYCWQVNIAGTENIAESSRKHNAFLIHVSTDMIFPGNEKDPGPYDEVHPTTSNSNELTWYGYTKLLAEKRVKEILNSKAAIVRIIYPVRAKYDPKLDYLRKPLKLYKEGELYPLFDDQQISIAFIDEISLAISKIIEKKLMGIFHVSSVDTTTPHEIVSYLVEKIGGDKSMVKASRLSESEGYKKNSVRYPMFGGLKTQKTQEELGIKFSTWREIVDILIEQGIGN